MRYLVLGPVALSDGRRTRPIGSTNQRVVLAVLLARRGTVVSLDALVEALWGEAPPASAVSTARTYVSRLRRVVGADLWSHGGGYCVDVPSDAVDADRFAAVVGRADDEVRSRTATEHTVVALAEALSWWRGDAFGELADVEAVRSEARRLDELRVVARELHLTSRSMVRPDAAVVADAEALVVDHPLRESSWVVLVDALLAAGRAADAVRAASRARDALAGVGLEPSDSLRHAESVALGIGTASDRRAPVPMPMTMPMPMPVPTLSRPTGGVAPVVRPVSTFVGREALVDELVALVSQERLVTLVGPGGVGKTRLATEVAATAASRWRHGCRVVSLGGVVDDGAVADAIIGGLGVVVGEGSAREALVRAGHLELLLVLDNAEHVVAAVADAVDALVSHGGSLHVLVTSRERLGVDGEQIRAVRPLAAGDPGSPAHRLLRARALAAGAVPESLSDADLIEAIVTRLDGLPLAIEMAAAQLAHCTPSELIDTLDRDLSVLRSPRRGVEPRQESLGALIDWSVRRLPADDVARLRDLAVFASAFSEDDAAAVLGPSVRVGLRRLADRSLVTAALAEGRTRFAVLRVIRDHLTASGLQVSEAARAAHARWCLARCRALADRLPTPDEPAAQREILGMLDDVRSAMRWASTAARPVALATVAALHRFAQSSLNDEVLSWAERLVDAVPARASSDHAGPNGSIGGDDPDDLAVVLAGAATRRITSGRHRDGIELAQRALAIAATDRARLPALEALADVALYDGRLDDSRDAYAELAVRSDAVGDRWYGAVATSGVGLVAAYAGTLTPDALDALDVADDATLAPTARALLAYTKGELLLDRDPGAALRWLELAIDLARSIPNATIAGVALVSAASLRGRHGDVDEAARAYRETIEHWRSVADHTHQVTTLRNVVGLLQRMDLPLAAAEVLGALDGVEVPTYGVEQERVQAVDVWLRGHPDAAAIADRRRAGARHDVAAAAALVVATIDEHVGRRSTAGGDRDT